MYNQFLFNVIPNSILLSYSMDHMTYKFFINNKRFISSIYFFWGFSESQLKFFSDLLIVDFPIFVMRFLSVYNIVSLLYNIRFIFKFFLDSNLTISSITKCYPCASWFERECWDMFGVFYSNNLDLRRILNDYGFNGHPLKKDFPLNGYTEIVFYLFFNLVFYDSIKMNQEFRFFYITSPWKIFI